MTTTKSTPSRYQQARARSAELQRMTRRQIATICAEHRVRAARPGATDFATEMAYLRTESKRHTIQGILAAEFDADTMQAIFR